MTLQATPTFPGDLTGSPADALIEFVATAPARAPEASPPGRSRPHAHDRRCFWDPMEARWAGPAHPDPRGTLDA